METKHNETATAHEWDEMRAQWAVLNRKLSHEPLVDDRHIRESMGKHQAWGKRISKTRINKVDQDNKRKHDTASAQGNRL